MVSVYGPEYVVIKCGASGQLLYDVKTKRKWEVSAYPARVADPTGVGMPSTEVFLAGYCKNMILWKAFNCNILRSIKNRRRRP